MENTLHSSKKSEAEDLIEEPEKPIVKILYDKRSFR